MFGKRIISVNTPQGIVQAIHPINTRQTYVPLPQAGAGTAQQNPGRIPAIVAGNARQTIVRTPVPR